MVELGQEERLQDDKSGEFLFKCLHKAKISNQSNSDNLKDGLKLNSPILPIF